MTVSYIYYFPHIEIDYMYIKKEKIKERYVLSDLDPDCMYQLKMCENCGNGLYPCGFLYSTRQLEIKKCGEHKGGHAFTDKYYSSPPPTFVFGPCSRCGCHIGEVDTILKYPAYEVWYCPVCSEHFAEINWKKGQ